MPLKLIFFNEPIYMKVYLKLFEEKAQFYYCILLYIFNIIIIDQSGEFLR